MTDHPRPDPRPTVIRGRRQTIIVPVEMIDTKELQPWSVLATLYGDWAVHPSVTTQNGKPAPDDFDWSVTHVSSGRQIERTGDRRLAHRFARWLSANATAYLGESFGAQQSALRPEVVDMMVAAVDAQVAPWAWQDKVARWHALLPPYREFTAKTNRFMVKSGLATKNDMIVAGYLFGKQQEVTA